MFRERTSFHYLCLYFTTRASIRLVEYHQQRFSFIVNQCLVSVLSCLPFPIVECFAVVLCRPHSATHCFLYCLLQVILSLQTESLFIDLRLAALH